MTERKRTFRQMQRLAHHLGQAIGGIEEKRGWLPAISTHSKSLMSIDAAMNLVCNVPNASLSQETLNAIDQQLDLAVAEFKKWVTELLNPDPKDDEPDEIEF